MYPSKRQPPRTAIPGALSERSGYQLNGNKYGFKRLRRGRIKCQTFRTKSDRARLMFILNILHLKQTHTWFAGPTTTRQVKYNAERAESP